MRIFLILLLAVAFQGLFAQGVTITGRIVDAETLDPLPFAHVFIDQTTIGAVSDVNGDYIIEHVENGDYKIVFSFVGYEMFYKTISITGQDERVSVRLVPTKEMLESVEVRGTKDKEWEKQLKQFNRVFFGDTELAKDCKILNPWVLDFRIDWDKTFKATASEPLKIENRALGYSMECALQGFSFDKKGYKIKGLYKFDELNTLDKKEAAKWTRNRRMAYQGSIRFLFKSIIENHETENGFALYSDLRPSLTTATTGYLSYELGKTVQSLDLSDKIQPIGRPGYYQISVPDRLEIHHTTKFAQTKTYRDVPYPVSWIEAEKGYVMVSADGNIVNNDHIVTSGELYHNRIANMLPLNYSPGTMVVINYLTKRAQARRLQEKVYLQTDKGFYYPGEVIWFKSYLAHANKSIRDSLSSVLYVDLVNPAKEIVQSKKIKIDSTGARGEFEIPIDAKTGMYYVRAYTKWMLNYGSEVIYYKPVGILHKELAVKSNDPIESRNDFTITIAQNKFNWPGNLELNALLDSSNNNFMANCSISVSPVDLQLPYEVDMDQVYQFSDEMPVGTLADFVYPLEYDFSIHGQIYRPKKKSTSGMVTIIPGKMDSIFRVRTDRKGYFTLDNLSFFDTVTFSFQARDKKNRAFANIKLLPDNIPAIQTPKIYLNKLDTIPLVAPILINELLPKDTLVVALEKQDDARQANTSFNSHADYILEQSQLEMMPSSMNIIDALVGKVPGLQYNPSNGKLSFGGRNSNRPGMEPLIVVDGIPLNMGVGSNPGNNAEVVSSNSQPTPEYKENQPAETSTTQQSSTDLSNQARSSAASNQNSQQSQSLISTRDLMGHITVEFVTRVEVMTNGDPRYGVSSSSGVISIYTSKTPARGSSSKTMESIVVTGFAKPKNFHPATFNDLSHPDYNPTTVYWNPSVSVSAHEVTKVLIEKPRKPGRYLVKIEGLSKEGNPVSGAIIFTIDRSAEKADIQN